MWVSIVDLWLHGSEVFKIRVCSEDVSCVVEGFFDGYFPVFEEIELCGSTKVEYSRAVAICLSGGESFKP